MDEVPREVSDEPLPNRELLPNPPVLRPEHGTMSSVDGRYLFTYTSSLPTLFQAPWRDVVMRSALAAFCFVLFPSSSSCSSSGQRKISNSPRLEDKWRWIVIISRPTSAYLDQASVCQGKKP